MLLQNALILCLILTFAGEASAWKKHPSALSVPSARNTVAPEQRPLPFLETTSRGGVESDASNNEEENDQEDNSEEGIGDKPKDSKAKEEREAMLMELRHKKKVLKAAIDKFEAQLKKLYQSNRALSAAICKLEQQNRMETMQKEAKKLKKNVLNRLGKIHTSLFGKEGSMEMEAMEKSIREMAERAAQLKEALKDLLGPLDHGGYYNETTKAELEGPVQELKEAYTSMKQVLQEDFGDSVRWQWPPIEGFSLDGGDELRFYNLVVESVELNKDLSDDQKKQVQIAVKQALRDKISAILIKTPFGGLLDSPSKN